MKLIRRRGGEYEVVSEVEQRKTPIGNFRLETRNSIGEPFYDRLQEGFLKMVKDIPGGQPLAAEKYFAEQLKKTRQDIVEAQKNPSEFAKGNFINLDLAFIGTLNALRIVEQARSLTVVDGRTYVPGDPESNKTFWLAKDGKAFESYIAEALSYEQDLTSKVGPSAKQEPPPVPETIEVQADGYLSARAVKEDFDQLVKLFKDNNISNIESLSSRKDLFKKAQEMIGDYSINSKSTSFAVSPRGRMILAALDIVSYGPKYQELKNQAKRFEK